MFWNSVWCSIRAVNRSDAAHDLEKHRSTGAHGKGLCVDRHGKQPAGQGPDEENDGKEEPPDTLGAHISTLRRESFKKIWLKIPKHAREIKFKLGGRGGTPKIIGRLGDVLMKYSHRFSKGQEDLGLHKSDHSKSS